MWILLLKFLINNCLILIWLVVTRVRKYHAIYINIKRLDKYNTIIWFCDTPQIVEYLPVYSEDLGHVRNFYGLFQVATFATILNWYLQSYTAPTYVCYNSWRLCRRRRLCFLNNWIFWFNVASKSDRFLLNF